DALELGIAARDERAHEAGDRSRPEPDETGEHRVHWTPPALRAPPGGSPAVGLATSGARGVPTTSVVVAVRSNAFFTSSLTTLVCPSGTSTSTHRLPVQFSWSGFSGSSECQRNW